MNEKLDDMIQAAFVFQKREKQNVFDPQSRAVSRANYVAPFHARFRPVTVAQLRCRRHEACMSLDLYNYSR